MLSIGTNGEGFRKIEAYQLISIHEDINLFYLEIEKAMSAQFEPFGGVSVCQDEDGKIRMSQAVVKYANRIQPNPSPPDHPKA